MADNSILPKAQSQLVDQAGRPTRAFYNFFNALVSQFQSQINTLRDVVTKLAAVIAALGGDAGDLPDISAMIAGKADKTETLQGTQSIRGGGDLSSPRLFALDGDMDAPPALSFYGVLTDDLGRGWQLVSGNFAALDNGDGTYALDLADLADSGTGVLLATTFDAKGRKTGSRAATITGTAGRVTVANGDAAAGLPTIDLATVADAGGGVLQRTDFDTYGRKTGTSAASTDDLTEGSRLYFTAARVLATVLTGLSLATSAVIAATDTVLQAFGKLQAQITDNLLPPGYIGGLKMVWVSGTALTVTTGAAYIPGTSKVLRVSSDIAKTGLSLTASAWYHVYLYDNAGTPDVEIVITAPAAAYSGTARSKTGDTSRRYVGSVLAGSSGNIWNFVHDKSTVMYDVNAAGTAPFRVLANGTATTATNVSVSGCAPTTAWRIVAKVDNTATNVTQIGVGRNGSGGSPLQGSIAPQTRGQWLIALNGSTFGYVYNVAPTPSGGYVDVIGYEYGR